MTKRLTETDYLKQARAVSLSLDGSLWERARIAAEMKARNIETEGAECAQWAEKLGALPEVRKAAKTVREWAQAHDFRAAVQDCGGIPLLPFSFFARASRYVDTVPFTSITELMDTYAASPGANFESFCAALSELAEPDDYRAPAAVIRRTEIMSERIGRLGLTLGLPDAYYHALADAQAALAAGCAALEAEMQADAGMRVPEPGEMVMAALRALGHVA